MEQRLQNEELFKVVKNFHQKEVCQDVFHQHSALLPKLRPYQEQAVQWMLSRERVVIEDDLNYSMHHCFLLDSINFLFKMPLNILMISFFPFPVVQADDIASGSSEDEQVLPIVRIPTGGILSDEMGLGKTVEVLACVLHNPRLDVVSLHQRAQFFQLNLCCS